VGPRDHILVWDAYYCHLVNTVEHCAVRGIAGYDVQMQQNLLVYQFKFCAMKNLPLCNAAFIRSFFNHLFLIVITDIKSDRYSLVQHIVSGLLFLFCCSCAPAMILLAEEECETILEVIVSLNFLFSSSIVEFFSY